MTTLKQLKQEVKEFKLDYEIAQGRYFLAKRRLEEYQRESLLAKRAKCKHTNVVKEWKRRFEGEGFVDTEYSVCKKCGEVFHVRDVNVVLKSEK